MAGTVASVYELDADTVPQRATWHRLPPVRSRWSRRSGSPAWGQLTVSVEDLSSEPGEKTRFVIGLDVLSGPLAPDERPAELRGTLRLLRDVVPAFPDSCSILHTVDLAASGSGIWRFVVIAPPVPPRRRYETDGPDRWAIDVTVRRARGPRLRAQGWLPPAPAAPRIIVRPPAGEWHGIPVVAGDISYRLLTKAGVTTAEVRELNLGLARLEGARQAIAPEWRGNSVLRAELQAARLRENYVEGRRQGLTHRQLLNDIEEAIRNVGNEPPGPTSGC